MCRRLRAEQEAVVALLESTANDPALYLDMEFRPWNINCSRTPSSCTKRTAYEDWSEPARKRHCCGCGWRRRTSKTATPSCAEADNVEATNNLKERVMANTFHVALYVKDLDSRRRAVQRRSSANRRRR
jgi:hypothetical protein